VSRLTVGFCEYFAFWRRFAVSIAAGYAPGYLILEVF
jgi:hypothetical protein